MRWRFRFCLSEDRMTAATARVLDLDHPNTRLQPRRSVEHQHRSLARLHSIAPCERLEHGGSESGMSLPSSRKFLTRSGVDADFKARLKEALRRRLYPNTGLHPDQLAGA